MAVWKALDALKRLIMIPLGGAQRLWLNWRLSTRLTVILAGTLLAVVVVSVLATAPLARTFMVRQIDNQVEALREDAFQRFERPRIDNEWQPRGSVVVFFAGDQNNIAFFSPGVNTELPAEVPRFTYASAQAQGERVFGWYDSKTHTEWRMAVRPVVYNDTRGTEGVLLVGQTTGVLHSLFLQQVLAVTMLSLAVALTGLMLGAWATRRAFAPLKAVEKSAKTIAAGQLSHRVPEFPAQTEMGSLSAALNTMLSRIEQAFQAQKASEQRTRRFAADASHELRTPLASLRGFAELYRMGAIEPEDIARTFGRIEQESQRMGELVEKLLLLARLDENRPVNKSEVDLAVLATDAAFDARGLDPSREITVVGLGPEGSTKSLVWAEENQLRQVITNLVGNALRHTPEGTNVEIAVGPGDAVTGPGSGADRVILEVRDHGPGLDRATAEKVFERFFREDSSRNRETGGSGLGLSIAAAIVHGHDGLIGHTDTSGGGATFRVSLPVYAHVGDAEQNAHQHGPEAPTATLQTEEPMHTGEDSA